MNRSALTTQTALRLAETAAWGARPRPRIRLVFWKPRRLLGEPNKALSTRTTLRFGNHGSIAVEVSGPKRGQWYDHEHEVGGGSWEMLHIRRQPNCVMPKEGGPGQEGATRGIAVLKGTAAHNAFARLREANARLLRRGRRLEAIFRLGGLRSIFELIEELIRHGLIAEAEIEWRLAAYAELDPRALKITGGDRLTPLPIRPIGGR